MKLKSKSLRFKIWVYLAGFSCLILLFLWVFQGLFFDKYYEIEKSKELSKLADKLLKSYTTDNFIDTLDELSFDKGICIEVITNGFSTYNSSGYNRGCFIDRKGSATYKTDFINSGDIKKAYKLVNPRFDNEILIYGIKLDNNVYAYINVSLVPLDSATVLLEKQLIIISFIVLLLATILAYYISKKLSKPIEKLSISAEKLSNGNYSDNFSSDTDIEEIKTLENNLNYMKDEFAKTDELRSDLLANVSHDLKTPLTMIKAYAEMVRDLTYKNKKKRDENLNVIIAESERLNILVNDILTLSSIQTKTKKLELTEFSLDELVRSVISRYDILIEQEHYEFIYTNECKSTNVIADYKKIEQVIYNILNNAINYTGDDLKVYISITELENTYRVNIKDTGKGIDKEEIKNIWDKYYHSDKKHKRNKIGTGLGLSIVKTILEEHNFIYGVESEKGQGTNFYFEISKSSK